MIITGLGRMKRRTRLLYSRDNGLILTLFWADGGTASLILLPFRDVHW